MNSDGAVVWVTQVPNRRDKSTGAFVPAVNISPATEHGQIKILMPSDAAFYATEELVAQLRVGLHDYDFDRGDSLIALGDPAIIAVAGAVLAEQCSAFSILRWDKNIGRYVKITIEL